MSRRTAPLGGVDDVGTGRRGRIRRRRVRKTTDRRQGQQDTAAMRTCSMLDGGTVAGPVQSQEFGFLSFFFCVFLFLLIVFSSYFQYFFLRLSLHFLFVFLYDFQFFSLCEFAFSFCQIVCDWLGFVKKIMENWR